MLFRSDNAQLVSLYAKAFQASGNRLYRKVAEETLSWAFREMRSAEHGFYCALDADSEGEEGKYYVWEKEELVAALGNRYPLFAEYFSVDAGGHWEHGRHILIRKKPEEEIASMFSLTPAELSAEIEACRKILMEIRSRRVQIGRAHV